MWVTGSGNNDVQYGKGANADLKIYNLDLTPLRLRREGGERHLGGNL